MTRDADVDARTAKEVTLLATTISDIAEGRRAMTSDDVRALIAAGHSREEIFDAIVAAAADPKASRRMHRALAVLRDTASRP